MNSETKTEQCDEWCKGCEEWTDELEDIYGVNLCSQCNGVYENKTGYCSLECCISGHCDDSC